MDGFGALLDVKERDRMLKKLQPLDIVLAARDLYVEEKAVKAVLAVESNSDGFVDDVRPVILFERHVFYRLLMQHNCLPANANPSIVNVQPGGYLGGVREWDRMDLACHVNRDLALQSASWGLFQIMGTHWNRLGFASIQGFVNAMYESEQQQLKVFSIFIKTDRTLWRALKEKDWVTFAKNYNGPAYQKNSYDVKLKNAYAKA